MKTWKWLLLLAGFGLFALFMSRDTTTPVAKPTDASLLYGQRKVDLVKVAAGFEAPTDMHFVPSEPNYILVAEKKGRLKWYHLISGHSGTLMKMSVLTRSEQGLLGLALHPMYPNIPCLYINAVIERQNKATSEVSEWCGDSKRSIRSQVFQKSRVILTLEQPFSNHNAGQLLFGPDGNLYIPWGDGGGAGDTLQQGQNTSTWLGSILRIQITPVTEKKPYIIPQDNPFIDHPGVAPEIYAYGFRNPWRGSFGPGGRLILGDVGQDRWEEITSVIAGGNHGWNHLEGNHCFPPGTLCNDTVFVPPLYEYSHSVGQSVTGGYVWLSSRLSWLQNQYIFGDFVSGRLWSLRLDDNNVTLLGQWKIAPVTFARDPEGQVYVVDFKKGDIYRISDALQPPHAP